ncbi:MAG: hypothetical protein O2866_00365 [archaeon]|jgi:phage pi2 protein 07|nr:hypothetical protein [archaeon]MDA1167319.1 hypothetical protein [archaeon]
MNTSGKNSRRQYTILRRHPRTTWNPLEDLKTLKQRTNQTTSEMMDQPIVPPLIRIEDDHWVFERVDSAEYSKLKHKLILQNEVNQATLGVTFDLDTALYVAGKIAENEGKIVLVETMSS